MVAWLFFGPCLLLSTAAFGFWAWCRYHFTRRKELLLDRIERSLLLTDPDEQELRRRYSDLMSLGETCRELHQPYPDWHREVCRDTRDALDLHRLDRMSHAWWLQARRQQHH